MMRIPFTATTQSRLEVARRALAESETKIAQLVQERAAALADSDDLDVLRTIDHRLADEYRTAQAARDRIGILEGKLVVEAATARAQPYEAGVDKIAELMAPLEKIASDVESAAVALSSAANKYVMALDTIAAKWPTAIPRPGMDHGGYPLSAHYLSRSRLGELVKRAFSPPSLVRSVTHAAPPASDYVARTCSAIERVEGFAHAERSNRVELIDDLKARGVPIHHVDDEAA